MTEKNLVICQSLFERTLRGLELRSNGKRESAAVWAGTIDAHGDCSAQSVYFHHELCDDKGAALSLELAEDAKFRLYERLSQEGLKLVALLHTHPSRWVDLSPIDQRNQLCSRIGFWSIVVPWYGRRPWELRSMGIHVRRNHGWFRLDVAEVAGRFIINES